MFRLFSCFVLIALLQDSCLSQVTPPGGDSPINPGFAFRITQKFLDNGVETGLEALSMMLPGFRMPDIEETLFVGSKIKLTKSNLTRCDKPYVKLRILKNRDKTDVGSHSSFFRNDEHLNEGNVTNDTVSSSRVWQIRTERGVKTSWNDELFNPGNTNEGVGGISLEISGVNVNLQTHAEMSLKMIFFTSRENFDASFVIRNTSLNLEVNIGEENGIVKLASINCHGEGDIKITVDGIVSQNALNYLLDSSFVQGVLFGKLCNSLTDVLRDSFEKNMPQTMTSVLSNPSLTLDYSLTEAPIFGHDFIETRHAGTLQPTNDTQNWPFKAVEMININETNFMTYVFITDYMVNTLWQSLHRIGELKWKVLEHNVEHFQRNFPSPIFSRLLGDFKEMLRTPQHLEMEILMHSPPMEAFKFNGRKLALKLKSTLTFYETSPVRSKLLELDNTLDCELEVVLSSFKVAFDVLNFQASPQVTYAAPNLRMDELNSKLNTLIVPTFHSMLREIGVGGYPFPFPPSFGFANKIFENTPGMFILGMDSKASAGFFLGERV